MVNPLLDLFCMGRCLFLDLDIFEQLPISDASNLLYNGFLENLLTRRKVARDVSFKYYTPHYSF